MKTWQKKLLMSTALLGAAAPLVEPATNVNAKEIVYTVKSGDTLWGIANKYGVSVNALRSHNGRKSADDSRLAIGTKLKIPGSTGGTDGDSSIGDSESAEDIYNKSKQEQLRELVVPPFADSMRQANNYKYTFTDNTEEIPAKPYWNKRNERLPVMIEFTPNHPDYSYYVGRNMHRVINGKNRVILYLQHYKDEIYYYSPVLRYYDNDMKDYVNNGSTEVRKEIYKRIAEYDGGKYLPKHNKIEQDVRGNSIYKHTTGSSLTQKSLSGTGHGNGNKNDQMYGTMNYIASLIDRLNWDSIAASPYGERIWVYGQHNFRRYTAKPMYEATWSAENMRVTANDPNRHPDSYQKNRPHTRAENPTLGNITKRWGEYRSLGYLASGERFFNPHFPVDGVARNGRDGVATYNFREFPWVRDGNYGVEFHSRIDEDAFQWAMHKGYFGLHIGGTNEEYYRSFYDGNNRSAAEWRTAEKAYHDKFRAMKTMYDNSPSLRKNLARERHGALTGDKAVQALTVKYASLNSQPEGADNVIDISFLSDELYQNESGNYVHYSLTLNKISKESAHNWHDTQLLEQSVYRGDQLLQTFKRDFNSNDYDVTNGSDFAQNVYPEVEPGEKLTIKTNVKIFGPEFRNALYGGLETKTNFNNQRTVFQNSNKTPIQNSGKNNIFTYEYTVPDPDEDKVYIINSFLDRDTYTYNWDMRMDSYYHDAVNKVKIIVDKGDFIALDTQLVDENGRILGINETPIPGHRYKIVYRYKYESVNGRDAKRFTDVRVDYNIGRDMVGQPIHGREDTGTRQTETFNFKPKHNEVYSFETPYHVYETGQFDTEGSIAVGLDRYDLESDNNELSEDWSSVYDISVDNVRVVPSDTINTQTQLAEMLVQFDVDYDVPADIQELGQNVSIAIDLDGKTVYSTQHIRPGKNNNISIPIEIELEGNVDQVLQANVFANHNRDVYEEGVYTGDMANNYASGTGTISNEAIQAFYNSNNRETWTQYVHENNWNGQQVNYNTFNNIQRNFLRFTSPDNPRSVSRHNLFEDYQIDSVRFRSRLTRQRRMGNDGWIDLLEEEGYIKAGYGYELEIDVSYNTNALQEPFLNINNSDGTGRWTRPILNKPLLQDNVYIEMQDGQIRSALGDGGTQQALRLKEKSEDGGRVTWTFEIDGGDVLGTETVGRFYIGEDVTDGRYPITVFTPKIRGVNGKQVTAADALEYLLFDSKTDLGINVEGAASDDVTDHINR